MGIKGIKFEDEFCKTFFEEHSAPMLILEKNGKILKTNGAACLFYGYSMEEMESMDIFEINTAPKEKILESVDAAFKKDRYIFLFKHKLKDGNVKDVHVYLSPATIGGKNYLLSIIYEITENKLLEAKLTESEILFRTLANNMQSGLVMYKEKFIYANPVFMDMLGYTWDELKDMGAIDMIADDYKEDMSNSIRKGLENLDDRRFVVVKALKKSGEEFWIKACAGSLKYKGEIVRITSIADISEIVDLRNDLEQGRNLFKILIENIYSGIALYGKDNFIYVNSAFIDMFGYTEEALLSMNPAEFFDIEENQIYDIGSTPFQIDKNNRLSSRIIYKYTSYAGDFLYLDLFRTSVIHNGEQTGLAIFSDVTVQVQKEQNILKEKDKFEELSFIDSLTLINNRRALDSRLPELFDLAKRYSRPLSIIMFDIDFFKKINDDCGHPIGDVILKEISSIAKKDLRKSDFLARYGGEEFIIIAPETAPATAAEIAERLRFKIQNYDFNIERRVTVSLGITSLKDDDMPQTVLYRVDMALYKAKENGRNRMEVI